MDRDQSTMQQMPTAQAAARPLPCGTGCEAHHPRNGDSLHEDWNAAQLLLELRRSVDTTVYDAAAAAALQEAIRAAAAREALEARFMDVTPPRRNLPPGPP